MRYKLLTVAIQDGENLYYDYYKLNAKDDHKLIIEQTENFTRTVKGFWVYDIKASELKVLEKFEIINYK